MPSGKHSKSKSQNKFSQPELTRYGNSIERIGMMGSDSITMQSMTGVNQKDKRQNYSLGQQQAHLKQNLQKNGGGVNKQADNMLN